jgi:hypothetical protein
MSNYNPRTFTSLGLLRSIPAALLHRFFLPHRAFLESLQFAWPESPENLDHRALHSTLMKPLASMPDKRLAQAMFVVDEMSDEAGVAALVDAIRETDPAFTRDRQLENVVFVMSRWLIDAELVENTNARRYARENRTFRSYRTSLNLPAGRLDAVELAAFQETIATLLAPFYPPESVKLFQFPENDGSETLRFIVRHGGPLVREGIVKADAPGESDSCLFRREVFDVIVYDPQNNEVRIHAKKRDCDLYTHACGSQFLDNADAFPDTDKYTLEPLRTAREQSLVCSDIVGLKSITLIELDVHLGGELAESVLYRADDVFASNAMNEANVIHGRTIQAACFAVTFSHSRRTRFVTVQTPNKASFKRDNDGMLVEKWLRSAGFILSETSPTPDYIDVECTLAEVA